MAQLLPQVSTLWLLLLLFCLLLPFTWFRDLSFLSFASVLGTASYIASFALIFAYGFSTAPLALPSSLLSPHSLLSLMTTIGTLSFTLGVPVLTFAIAESMQTPSHFTRVMDATMAVIAVVFSVIGVLGVGLFSVREAHPHHHPASPSLHHGAHHHAARLLTEQVQPIILSNLPSSSTLSLVTQGLISVTLLLTAPLSLAPALNLLESIFARHSSAPSSSHSAAASSSDSEHAALLSRGIAQEAPPSYGGLHDLSHDLYNHSSDDEDDAHRTPAKRASILVRGKVASHGSLDSLTTSPFTASSSPSPARVASPHNRRAAASTATVVVVPHVVVEETSAATSSVMRVGVLGLIFVVAWTVPCFTLVMSIIGLVSLSLLCFVLPPVFYIRLEGMREVKAEEGEGGWWATAYLCYAYCFLAVGVLCIAAGAVVISRQRCE